MELEKLRKVVAEVLSVDLNEILEDTTFVEDLGADSLDLFQIVMGIESEFDITITTQEAEDIKTVKQAIALIKAKRPLD